MATSAQVNEPPIPGAASRGINTAAMLLLAAGIGLLALTSCAQAPEAAKQPEVAKQPEAKQPELATPPEVKPPEDVKPPEVVPRPEEYPPPAT